MIYIIQSQFDKRIKIGHSENPIIRLRQLRTGSSSPGQYVIKTILPGGSKRESDLKNRFKEFHSHGEWFNPVSELLDFLALETGEKKTLKHCRVCGAFYLSMPNDDDIKQHCKIHKNIRQGVYPYNVREFMKEIAWAMLEGDGEEIILSTHHDKEELKRIVVYAWWEREREKGMPDYEFDDFVLDYMDYLDARLSGNEEELKIVKKFLEKHWGRILRSTIQL